MNKNHKGFAHFGILILFVVVIVIIVMVGLTVVSRKDDKKSGPLSFISKAINKSKDNNNSNLGWDKDCQDDDRKPMTHFPMDLKDVQSITPYGMTAGAHVTPIDHLYFYPKAAERDKSSVYAMADGYIIEISSRGVNVSTGEQRPSEYRIVFQHSCQTITYFDLVTKLDDSIIKEIGQLKPNDSKGNLRIPVKAGQEIGRIGGQSLDTAVYNLKLTLKGFIHPEMYKAEAWKIHTDEFFGYFSQELQDQMKPLNIRKVAPLSGKIDYDQPGKLIGNWFKEGTNGYAGPKDLQNKPGSNESGYWNGHLAIFYDAITPTQIDISIGQFKGKPTAFAVKDNKPDPATISKSNGLTKYELIQAPNNMHPESKYNGPQPVLGTILFQVLDGEKLKVEVFPDKSSSQVDNFTATATTYER